MTEETKGHQYATDVARAKHPECANYSDNAVLSIFDFSGHDIEEAFGDGVDYALNSIWRKTEEEKPKDGQWVLGIYSDSTFLYWLKYNHCTEENCEWWCNRYRDECITPDYWMAIPKSPLWNNFSEEIW